MNLVNLLYLNNDFLIYNASYVDCKLDVSELLFNIQYTSFSYCVIFNSYRHHPKYIFDNAMEEATIAMIATFERITIFESRKFPERCKLVSV